MTDVAHHGARSGPMGRRRRAAVVASTAHRTAPRTVLATVGDPADPATFSGTPYHLVEAAARQGVIDAGLALSTRAPAWRRRRLLWNLARLAATGRRGGYQYAPAFLDALWRQDPPGPGDTVLSLFQLVPDGVLGRPGPVWFYVDQTLSHMFAAYGLRDVVPPAVRALAVARERAQYHAAAGVIGHSAWAARDVVMRYGVPAHRIHAVVCGANIAAAALDAWEARTAGPLPRGDGPLRLVFVGKDWRRKGLDRLIRGLALARAGRAGATLTVVGPDPADLPAALRSAPGVTFTGFVDKRRDAARFLDLVAACHVGCLPSRAEAGGIALREFCRLGLPTIAPAVGGAPEYVVPDATHLVAPDAGDGEIAAAIHRLASDRALFEAQQGMAWAARATASWDHAAAALGRILAGGRR